MFINVIFSENRLQFKMSKKISQTSKGIKKNKIKQGRPTVQQNMQLPGRSHNDVLRIADFPELVRMHETISKSSNVLVNVRTGPKQDKKRQQIVSEANMKQDKLFATLNKFDQYTYFLRNKIDRVELQGDNIIDLNGNHISLFQEYPTIERPEFIDSQYQLVYERLQILVRGLDEEFVPEFMLIVNTYIDAKAQNIDRDSYIKMLLDNISFSDQYKILKQWSELKANTNDLQIQYKQEDFNKVKKNVNQKSQNIRAKYEQLVQEEEHQIYALKYYKCPLEYFINRLIYDLDNLINSVRKNIYKYIISSYLQNLIRDVLYFCYQNISKNVDEKISFTQILFYIFLLIQYLDIIQETSYITFKPISIETLNGFYLFPHIIIYE
ncbi:hypothetical protein pb186bvf_004528 [Paramecium bursaria]